MSEDTMHVWITAVILAVLILICTWYIAANQLAKADLPKCPDCPICPEPTVITETVSETVEVTLNAQETYLDVAVADFLSDKLEDLTTCNGEEYDEDQILVSKVYKDWNVVFGEDHNDETDYTVSFKVKLKYLDSDVEEKCYDIKDVEVYYRQDKSPKITIV